VWGSTSPPTCVRSLRSRSCAEPSRRLTLASPARAAAAAPTRSRRLRAILSRELQLRSIWVSHAHSRAHPRAHPPARSFSAHTQWCPPCRGFTPGLAKRYTELKESGEAFELIYVSCDRDQASFDSYFASMSFAGLSFADKTANRALCEACDVSGIPSLCIFDEGLNLLTTNGRGLIMGTKPSAITKGM